MRKETISWWTEERSTKIKRKNRPRSERGREFREQNIVKRDYRSRRSMIKDLRNLAKIARAMDEENRARIFNIENLKPLFKAILEPPPIPHAGKSRTKKQLLEQRRILELFWALWMHINTWTQPLAPETSKALGGSIMTIGLVDKAGDVALITDKILAVEISRIASTKERNSFEISNAEI
jgi:hypothetical protein